MRDKWIPLLLTGICLISVSGTARGAGVALSPSVAVSEEYNDNVSEVSSDRKSALVTQVQPGFVMKYNGPVMDWDLLYNFSYRYFLLNNKGDELYHNLMTTANVRIIDEFMFLNISDSYTRASLSTYSNQNESQYVNLSDTNNFTVSPYLQFNPLPRLKLKTGYQYQNVTYSQAQGVNRQEQSAYMYASHELTHRLNLLMNFTYAHTNTSQGVTFNRYTPSLGLNYTYAEGSSASLEGGYSWFPSATGKTGSSPYWKVGLVHAHRSVTASLDASVSYYADPTRSFTEQRSYSGRINKQLHRGYIGVSALYTEIKDDQLNAVVSDQTGGSINGVYELTPYAAAHLELSADKFRYNGSTGTDFNLYHNGLPYNISLGGGLTYTFVNDLTGTVDYNYSSYRKSFGSSSGSIDINRIIIGLRKGFKGLSF